MLVSDLILESFVDLAVIQPGMSISSGMQTDAFTRLNQLLGQLSAEGASSFNQVVQPFLLQAGRESYTFGVGGDWATANRAQKITGWKATYNDQRKGGPALPMDQFGTASAQAQTELLNLYTKAAQEGVIPFIPASLSAPIPSLLCADTAWPLINVRVWPIPSNPPGTIELAYWSPISQFATVGDTINLPPGYDAMLHWNLALALFPTYARPGQSAELVAGMAQSTKASIVTQNSAMAAPPAGAQ